MRARPCYRYEGIRHPLPDSSLLLCTVESLINHKFDLHDMGQRFIRWYHEGYWTPWGKVFDMGGTTRRAISRLEQGVEPKMAGDSDENSNGSGSLMRILPIALRFADSSLDEVLNYAHRASSLTRRHPRSQIACSLHCLMVVALLKYPEPLDAYTSGVEIGLKTYATPPYLREMAPFRRFVSGEIHELPKSHSASGGHAIDTLETSAWCLLNSSSFEEAVLEAVNLGGDSDTTACITGRLAGTYYGVSAIPGEWISKLSERDRIGISLNAFTNRCVMRPEAGRIGEDSSRR